MVARDIPGNVHHEFDKLRRGRALFLEGFSELSGAAGPDWYVYPTVKGCGAGCRHFLSLHIAAEITDHADVQFSEVCVSRLWNSGQGTAAEEQASLDCAAVIGGISAEVSQIYTAGYVDEAV